MGGAESVKEVQERHPAFNGSKVCDGAEVHDLLRVGGGEHGKAGLATGHDIRMIPENGESVGGDGTGGAVDDARQQFTSDLQHVGDHKQQALRGRKGSGQSACGEGAVKSTRCAALGLHFSDVCGLAKNILAAIGCPDISKLCHDG
ncbi:hypothetical protein SDC9_68350 [bioreactor metagenome]|uniref:Uncharacterized protein n=1 Tax=bioreactor metagenome TaxID=1076179 RepID=A0A644Y075_9ZZZZ